MVGQPWFAEHIASPGEGYVQGFVLKSAINSAVLSPIFFLAMFPFEIQILSFFFAKFYTNSMNHTSKYIMYNNLTV